MGELKNLLVLKHITNSDIIIEVSLINLTSKIPRIRHKLNAQYDTSIFSRNRPSMQVQIACQTNILTPFS